MKNLVKTLLLVTIVWCCAAGAVLAQTSAKETAMKNKLLSKHFIFVAEYAQPLGGGQKYLTSTYDLKIRPDSVIAELPYFGRVYMDAPIYPEDAGINFTSTKFDYSIIDKKKKGYVITIDLHDQKRTRRFTIYTSLSGFSTVTVTSDTRDPITFQGYIEDEKEKESKLRNQ